MFALHPEQAVATIDCHDGWGIDVYRLVDYGYDHRGVDSVRIGRPDNMVEVPVDDIPALIEALQRFVADDEGTGR